MIGIEFEYKSTYELLLNDIFRNIDFNKYEFSIKQKEVIYENELEYLKNEMDGNEFKIAINSMGNYFVNYINLQVFLNNSKKDTISNYDDFLKSDCELVLLVSDNSCIELYFKDNELKNKILNNIKKMKINYNIKTIHNDCRTIFEI